MSRLALEYRPRSFTDMAGQKPVRVVLRQMLKSGDLPAAMLFSGVRGTGKTTSARIIAAALNCTAELETTHGDPCGVCASCRSIFDSVSPDVIEVDAASNGLVGDIRKLRETVLYSAGGQWRVVLLDECHSMSREGQNALLKTLEEPPPQTLFILLTTEPGKILETIISRCMTFEFQRISTADIVERLRLISLKEDITADEDLLVAIAERSNGGMRDAVMTLDQVSRVGVTSQLQFQQLLGESDYAPRLLQAVLAGDLPEAFRLSDEQMLKTGDAYSVSTELVALLKDLFVLKAGGSLQKQGEPLEVRAQVAAAASMDHLTACARVLWDLRTKVRSSEDARASLELGLVMMVEAVRGGRQQVQPEAPKKLSLRDMAAMR